MENCIFKKFFYFVILKYMIKIKANFINLFYFLMFNNGSFRIILNSEALLNIAEFSHIIFPPPRLF